MGENGKFLYGTGRQGEKFEREKITDRNPGKINSEMEFRSSTRNIPVGRTFGALAQLELPTFLEQLGIGFHKNSVVDSYKLTRDKLGTGINGSVIKGASLQVKIK